MRIEKMRLKTYNGARKRAPWAAVIARTYGGFIAFESVDDFLEWKKQQ